MNNLIQIKYKLNSSLFKIGEDLDLIRYSGFSFVENIKSTANLSQLRLVDARRLSRKIGEISQEEFVQLTKQLKALLP